MARSLISLEEICLLSSENSFDSCFLGLVTNEKLRLSSHEEPRSEGYDEYFDPPLERKYECPICHLGLREPVQTSCGHRFCRGCIVRSIRDGGTKCTVDGERLLESQIYPDNFAKREMMAHEVFCRAKKLQGCTWKGPLGKLQEHLKECPFVSVNCANNCGKQLQRRELQRHMTTQCSLRKVPCEYCENEVLWNDTEDHFVSCSKYPQQCEKCKQEGIERGKMAFHLEHHCPNEKIKCPCDIAGCTFEGLRSEVTKHVHEQMTSHLMNIAKALGNVLPELGVAQTGAQRGAPTRCARGGTESIPQEQASLEENLNELPTSLIQHQRNEMDEMKHTITVLTRTVNHLERQVKEALMRLERPVQELTLRILEDQRRFCNGVYTWRIENFTQCREDAINGVMKAKYSPPFYTSPYGYKLCMRINLNGINRSVGKQVALFVHVILGGYDDKLVWPFTGKFSLSILDQSDDVLPRRHISKTIDAEPSLQAFQRPTAPYNNIGYGFEEFASLEQICEPQYVKNNTLLVKFEINH